MEAVWIFFVAALTMRIDKFKHQTLFATQTQTQRNLIVKANQMCRNCHAFISHWLKNLGYFGFEFTLQVTFGAYCPMRCRSNLQSHSHETKNGKAQQTMRKPNKQRMGKPDNSRSHGTKTHLVYEDFGS